MFAESFKVRPWLEEPSKWLRWAMQSVTARKLEDARYNLGKFWASLEVIKAKASGALDWAELLTLNAQSKWALGTLYQADQHQELVKLNGTLTARNIIVPLTLVATAGAASMYFAAETAKARQKIIDLGTAAEKAFNEQTALGNQAAEAYKTAGNTDNQAANAAKVGAYSAQGATKDTRFALNQSEVMGKPLSLSDLLPDFLTGSFLGIPAWAWIAGGAGLALFLATSGPRIVALSAARSLMPERATS